jgi:hypothetical protein
MTFVKSGKFYATNFTAFNRCAWCANDAALLERLRKRAEFSRRLVTTREHRMRGAAL